MKKYLEELPNGYKEKTKEFKNAKLLITLFIFELVVIAIIFIRNLENKCLLWTFILSLFVFFFYGLKTKEKHEQKHCSAINTVVGKNVAYFKRGRMHHTIEEEVYINRELMISSLLAPVKCQLNWRVAFLILTGKISLIFPSQPYSQICHLFFVAALVISIYDCWGDLYMYFYIIFRTEKDSYFKISDDGVIKEFYKKRV